MRGYIEIKEDSYEDTIEHLTRIKSIACKLIKMLSEQSEDYSDEEEEEEDDEPKVRGREMYRGKGRYGY